MRFSSRIPLELEPNPWSVRLAERRAAGADLVDLSEANPTRTGLTPRAWIPLDTWERGVLERYEPDPRGSYAARLAIGDYYASRGRAIDCESIVLTASTSEAYAHLFRLLADPGETVLVPRPSYPLFVPLARAEGVAVATYDVGGYGADDVDLDAIERAIGPRTRAIVVVQPNHPTGSCLDSEQVRTLDALAARRGLAIIADEVFGDYPWPPEFRPGGRAGGRVARARSASDEPPMTSGLPSFAGDREALTFVLSGLSKVCGLPQMKAAWIVVAGSAAARAPAMERLTWLADLFLSVSAPAQAALPKWLHERHDFQQRTRERIALNLGQLAAAQTRGAAHTLQHAHGGWVGVLRFPQRRTDEQWALDLLEAGVILHPGHFYDYEVDSIMVTSLIIEPREFARGLERIEAVIARG